MNKRLIWMLLLSSCCIFSCKTYHQYRMFQTEVSIINDSLNKVRQELPLDYIIVTDDVITFEIFTNNGERIVDPNLELLAPNQTQPTTPAPPKQYTVYADGYAYLPMIGKVHLAGLKLPQADSILSLKFNAYYKDPYVKTAIVSKRVIVFGPKGGKVVPLPYQNMNLIEVMAQYGEMDIYVKMNNVRVIRGDLKNPDVQVIDLTTVAGMQQATLDMQPGDIVYIEPKRRVVRDIFSDIYPLVGIITSTATLLVLISTINQ